MLTKRNLSTQLSSLLIVASLLSGCSSTSMFSGSANGLTLSKAATEEMNAVNAAMNAVEILYQRALKQDLIYYSPVNFALAEQQRADLLSMYENYEPDSGSWFSGSGSEEIELEADHFIQRINLAFQAKLITAPSLTVIRDHDEFIKGLDPEGFTQRITQIRNETKKFVGMAETKGTVIGLEHKQAKLEREYKALEIDMVKRKVMRLPTAEFNQLDQDLVPESYKLALHELYSLERLIEKNPRDNTAIQDNLNASYIQIKQAGSIAKEVIWVKSRIENSAERVVMNYRNHLSLLNQYLGTENLTALDFQSQIRGIKDAVESKLSQSSKQASASDEHTRQQLTKLAQLLTGQDMSKYSVAQQVDSLVAAAQTLVDESVQTPFSQH